jgi:agmatine deiminase
MYPDQDTNFVYFSSLLKKYHGIFFKKLSETLTRNNIPFGLLEHTKDIWCRDFMPVQLSQDNYIQFFYEPDYMQTPQNRPFITNAQKTCESIGIKPVRTGIRIDGGNIIRWKKKAIMTDKIFDENPGWDRPLLLKLVQTFLQLDEIIIIPREPYEATGHADGWVRFLDEYTVLLAEYPKWECLGKTFKDSLESALKKNGLDIIRFPSSIIESPKSRPIESAKGCYINYLQVGDLVILPVFKMEADDRAYKTALEVFRGHKIETLYSASIANEGGVLNCVSWNIYRGDGIPVEKESSDNEPREPVLKRNAETEIKDILRLKEPKRNCSQTLMKNND